MNIRTLFVLFLTLCCLHVNAQLFPYKELLYGGANKELIQLIRDEIPEDEIVGDMAHILAQAYEGLFSHYAH